MKYPTDIVTDNDWERIHCGHGIATQTLETDLRKNTGREPRPGEQLLVEEVSMRLVPRVKWCSQLGGFGCDQEGQWHQHWESTPPGSGEPFTLVRWGKVDNLAGVR